MLILGIDTCCMAATAAVMDQERLVAQTVVNRQRTHSQTLMPQIETMLSLTGLTAADMDCYAAAVGPGSFTGVRIGVATAKALAQAGGKPCVPVSTLEALANNVTLFPGILCPIQDARRNQVYNALFRGGPHPVRLCPDRALDIGALTEELIALKEPVIFCGDGVPVYYEALRRALGDRAAAAQRMQRMNLAASVAELGLEKYQRGETVPYGELVPQYLRLSQAERERLERMEDSQTGASQTKERI